MIKLRSVERIKDLQIQKLRLVTSSQPTQEAVDLTNKYGFEIVIRGD